MKSASKRAAIAALLLAPFLSACGFGAQTDKVYQPAEGVLDRSGTVYILNALIVSGTDGSGTLVASLVNNDDTQDAKLVSISGNDVEVPGKAITIPPGGAVDLSKEGAISVVGDSVVAGRFIALTFSFASGQSTDLKLPVVPAEGDYAEVPLPSESPSASPSATPSGPVTTGPTETPSQESTGSAE